MSTPSTNSLPPPEETAKALFDRRNQLVALSTQLDHDSRYAIHRAAGSLLTRTNAVLRDAGIPLDESSYAVMLEPVKLMCGDTTADQHPRIMWDAFTAAEELTARVQTYGRLSQAQNRFWMDRFCDLSEALFKKELAPTLEDNAASARSSVQPHALDIVEGGKLTTAGIKFSQSQKGSRDRVVVRDRALVIDAWQAVEHCGVMLRLNWVTCREFESRFAIPRTPKWARRAIVKCAMFWLAQKPDC